MTAVTTGAELGARLRLLVRGTGRSTTRRALRGLTGGLLALSVLVLGTTLAAFTRVHDTAGTVRARTVPAIHGIAVAKSALVDANNAAVTAFEKGAVQLVGPGGEFQSQIATTSQSLTLVAEANVAGERGSRNIQLVGAMLTTYTGLVWQAVEDWQAGARVVGVADLLSASRMVHMILARLDALLESYKQILDGQLSRNALTPLAVLMLFLPIAGLLVLLVVAHCFLRRRFRRRINGWLALSAVLLVALSWVSSRTIVAQHRLDDARSTLYQLVDDGQTRIGTTDSEGQQALQRLFSTTCGSKDGCVSDTLARFNTEVSRMPAVLTPVEDNRIADRIADETRAVADLTAAATGDAVPTAMIYLLGALIATTILLGFLPRLNEYRYRPR
jgi:hypothetical protein